MMMSMLNVQIIQNLYRHQLFFAKLRVEHLP